MKIITSWHTLMKLAKAVGDAKKSNNLEALKIAEQELRNYEQLVKRSDGMLTGMTHGEL